MPSNYNELPVCECCALPTPVLISLPEWDCDAACAETYAQYETEVINRENREPECTCRYIAADLVDARGCEAHSLYRRAA